MIESAVYNIVLDNVTGDEKLGVKVEYDEFAYKGGQLEIGQRCVAPLYNLENTQVYMYTGFIIETPKLKDSKHGNDMRNTKGFIFLLPIFR